MILKLIIILVIIIFNYVLNYVSVKIKKFLIIQNRNGPIQTLEVNDDTGSLESSF